MSSAPLSISKAVIHHRAALRAVDAAIARAEALGIAVCVAVADSTGRLVAYARMPQAFLISDEIAMKKAQSVAAIGLPAEDVERVLTQEAPRVREGLLLAGLTLIQGGLPIRCNGELIGAVGVSGGSEAQDTECATVAVSALIS